MSQAELEAETVLIDDDESLGFAWKIAAKRAAKTFHYFKNLDNFILNSAAVDKRAAVYLDTEFNGVLEDLDRARVLITQAGFTQVYICTGHNGHRFENVDWIKGVVGKNPPWLSK